MHATCYHLTAETGTQELLCRSASTKEPENAEINHGFVTILGLIKRRTESWELSGRHNINVLEITDFEWVSSEKGKLLLVVSALEGGQPAKHEVMYIGKCTTKGQ